MHLRLNVGVGQGKNHSPYSWHTSLAGAGTVEQAHAESEREQMEPVEFRQVDPVPQNWAEEPVRHKATNYRTRQLMLNTNGSTQRAQKLA